jgi:Flp pilus assembly protein TadG
MKRLLFPRVSSRLQACGGSNLLEAALITPLLLMLTFGIVDFASVFWVWLALQNGASQATRFAVTGNGMGTLSREDSIRAAMRNATPSLTIADAAFSFSHLPPGGGAWITGAGGPNDIGKVTINYTWPIFTPLLRPFFPGGQVTFAVESAMKNERRFE